MPKLNMGKFRDVTKGEKPYLKLEDKNNAFGPTTFEVLKAYQKDPNQPYARVMVRAISPMTGSLGDMGDAYWGDVTGEIVYRDPVVEDSDLPNHLLGKEKTATTLQSVVDDLFSR